VNKSKLRSKILKLRKKNEFKKIKIKTENILFFLKKNNIKSRNIGGYYPCNYEIDDLEILNSLRKKKFKVSLPIIKNNNQMDFFEWSLKNPFKVNKYGITEPMLSKKSFPEIIFIPLVAFDRQLNRLGYGGGFYDRYIAKINKTKKVIKIGLAFSFQELKKISINKFDKKLDYIITDKEVIS
tara:strand:+ start:255 stop:800 length:546 start_codon:yes stop_codon:yes gene_type:complete